METLQPFEPMTISTLVVIPARAGSSRLPRKPLRLIAGRTLLHRTIAMARAATAGLPDTQLLVATDDQEIAAHARAAWPETAPRRCCPGWRT